MLRKMIAILITSMILSSCATTTEFAPVTIPAKPYIGTVKKESILQCPEHVRWEVFVRLKQREQYIETLIETIKAHNEAIPSE